jgi:hypothetical protein
VTQYPLESSFDRKQLPHRARTAKVGALMPKNEDYRAYHKVDSVKTPLFEQLFMVAATGLVLVGLPIALAAVFHFVVPFIGRGWGN